MMNKDTRSQMQDAIAEHKAQLVSGRLGVITSYDEKTNTATVAITKEQTDEIEQIITKVMCPRVLGVQSVAPDPGLMCWVSFKNNNITQPLITQFYNHRYEMFDYPKQNPSYNTLPSYLMGL